MKLPPKKAKIKTPRNVQLHSRQSFVVLSCSTSNHCLYIVAKTICRFYRNKSIRKLLTECD